MEQITCKRGECWFEDIETTLGFRSIYFFHENVFANQNLNLLKAVLELASHLKNKKDADIIDKETLKLVPVETKNIHVYFG